MDPPWLWSVIGRLVRRPSPTPRHFVTRIVVSILAVNMIFLHGCEKPVAQKDRAEWSDEHITQAQNEARNGKIEHAISLYTEALKFKPDLAIGHLELALLLHSFKSDYVPAIYHYNQYLSLSPGSEKEAVVKGLILKASEKFSEQFWAPDETAQPGTAADMEKEINALRRSVKDSEETLTKARAQIRRLQQQVAAEQAQSATLTAKLEGATKTESKPVVRAEIKPKPKPTPEVHVPTVKTYEVLRGDTLSKIALKVYKDPGTWRKIFDANKETLGGSELVRPGQILVIP